MIREEIILKEIENKDVLDIGSVGQSKDYDLFKQMKAEGNYKSLTGIDPLPSNDPNIIQGDMETANLDKKFDVIVAGGMIEHLSNQGLFLENILRHLKDDGKLIITTINCKWITALLKPNPTHTLWHDKYTLQYILGISGFKVDTFKYFYGNKHYYGFIKRILALRQGMLVICSKNLKQENYKRETKRIYDDFHKGKKQ